MTKSVAKEAHRLIWEYERRFDVFHKDVAELTGYSVTAITRLAQDPVSKSGHNTGWKDMPAHIVQILREKLNG